MPRCIPEVGQQAVPKAVQSNGHCRSTQRRPQSSPPAAASPCASSIPIDEVLFDAARPVILNGITDFVTRPDLADRAVFLTLEPIPEERRRPEQELWAAFEAERPRILGALLDAVAKDLAIARHEARQLPRMADFALWATACETALWPAGTFWSAYCGNRDEAVDGVIDADPIAAAVRAGWPRGRSGREPPRTFWAPLPRWRATARKSKTWPDGPRALAGRLRRAATFLRKLGIEIGFERDGRARTAIIRITAAPTTAPETGGARPSAPSASSARARKRGHARTASHAPTRWADSYPQFGRSRHRARRKPPAPTSWPSTERTARTVRTVRTQIFPLSLHLDE